MSEYNWCEHCVAEIDTPKDQMVGRCFGCIRISDDKFELAPGHPAPPSEGREETLSMSVLLGMYDDAMNKLAALQRQKEGEKE